MDIDSESFVTKNKIREIRPEIAHLSVGYFYTKMKRLKTLDKNYFVFGNYGLTERILNSWGPEPRLRAIPLVLFQSV